MSATSVKCKLSILWFCVIGKCTSAIQIKRITEKQQIFQSIRVDHIFSWNYELCDLVATNLFKPSGLLWRLVKGFKTPGRRCQYIRCQYRKYNYSSSLNNWKLYNRKVFQQNTFVEKKNILCKILSQTLEII